MSLSSAKLVCLMKIQNIEEEKSNITFFNYSEMKQWFYFVQYKKKFYHFLIFVECDNCINILHQIVIRLFLTKHLKIPFRGRHLTFFICSEEGSVNGPSVVCVHIHASDALWGVRQHAVGAEQARGCLHRYALVLLSLCDCRKRRRLTFKTKILFSDFVLLLFSLSKRANACPTRSASM